MATVYFVKDCKDVNGNWIPGVFSVELDSGLTLLSYQYDREEDAETHRKELINSQIESLQKKVTDFQDKITTHLTEIERLQALLE